MHPTQKKILALLEANGQLFLKYAQIGREIGEDHIQSVKYHLQQLEKRGYVVVDRLKKIVTKASSDTASSLGFSNIPFYGEANCGSPLSYAEDIQHGTLKISTSIVPRSENIIAVRAVGNSMDDADIKGKNIEDGDFVIVDTQKKDPKNGDYVLSIIDDGANIKRIFFDKTNQYVVLRPVSNDLNFRDIIIDSSDSYSVVGTVRCVIKKPKIEV